MAERPYTVLSGAMSIDGYTDDAADSRLLLSNEADFERVDVVRAACDAILVGATTVRNDNPRLLVRSRALQNERTARGLRPTPTKVTVTRSAQLDACANFFALGDTDKLVYCPSATFAKACDLFRSTATVVDGGPEVEMSRLSEDLYDRGVRRLMVEGGATMHTQFLAADLADELHLVVAPFFVGDSRARRFVVDGTFPWNARRRATLAEARQIDDVVLLRYALSERFCNDQVADRLRDPHLQPGSYCGTWRDPGEAVSQRLPLTNRHPTTPFLLAPQQLRAVRADRHVPQ